MIAPERVPGQRQRPKVAVNRIIGDRSQASIGKIPEHRNIRHKQQYGKLKPTAVAPMIGEDAQTEDGGAFEV
jgi:hypothetical protein